MILLDHEKFQINTRNKWIYSNDYLNSVVLNGVIYFHPLFTINGNKCLSNTVLFYSCEFIFFVLKRNRFCSLLKGVRKISFTFKDSNLHKHC